MYIMQLTVYNYKGGPCYRCLFPTPPPSTACQRCADSGVLGVGESVDCSAKSWYRFHHFLSSMRDEAQTYIFLCRLCVKTTWFFFSLLILKLSLFISVPGVIGCLQALEAIKIASAIGEPLSGRMLLLDALSARIRIVCFSFLFSFSCHIYEWLYYLCYIGSTLGTD